MREIILETHGRQFECLYCFSQANDRAFLFDIVANKRNSLDVDKFDYIERDCYNLGAKSSYDAKRLMWFSRVIDNQICYHEKEVYNLYEIFHTRYSLFKQMYTHRKGVLNCRS